MRTTIRFVLKEILEEFWLWFWFLIFFLILSNKEHEDGNCPDHTHSLKSRPPGKLRPRDWAEGEGENKKEPTTIYGIGICDESWYYISISISVFLLFGHFRDRSSDAQKRTYILKLTLIYVPVHFGRGKVGLNFDPRYPLDNDEEWRVKVPAYKMFAASMGGPL